MQKASERNNGTREELHLGGSAVALVIFSLDMIMVLPIVAGNVLVIVAYKRNRHLQTTINMIIVNLAVTDLFTGTVAIPLTCLVHYTTLNLAENKYICLSSWIVTHITVMVSCLTLLITAVYRFMASQCYTKPMFYLTKFKTLCFIIFTWLYTVIIVVVNIVFFNTWSDENPVCDMSVVLPSFHLDIGGVHLILAFFICTAIYTYLFFILSRNKNKIHQLPSDNETKMTSSCSSQELDITKLSVRHQVSTWWQHLPHIQHQGALKMLVTVLVLFYLCWLPSLIKILIASILYHDVKEPRCLDIFEQFATSILFLNSLMNPIIYAGLNRSFRRAFRQILNI